MSDKNYKTFVKISEDLTDKTKAITNFVYTSLDKLQSMFKYEGLPNTLKAEWLEHYLMCNGYAFITKVNGDLYALEGGLGGELDAYYQPTTIVISNPYLKFNKTCDINNDGVLVRNDTLMNGMLPILNKYGSLLVESDITIRLALINLRIYNTISASDDVTKKSADNYLQNIEKGKLGVIGEGAFFEGVKIQNNANSTGYLSQLIEMTQYIKASFLNEIGLNANYNLKREYISTSENTLADDILLPLAHDMLRQRQQAVDSINAMFGTNITVEFNSAWATNNSQNEKEIAENELAITNNDADISSDINSTKTDNDMEDVSRETVDEISSEDDTEKTEQENKEDET